MDTTHTSNELICVQTCSNIICHVYTRPLFWIRPTHQTSLYVFKHVQTSSATSTHVRCFWDRLKKPLQNHHEEKWTKSIRWALMPLTPMVQLCRFRCVRVRFVLNISASAWRNKTVQGRASISQTTHTTTSKSAHLGPKSTTPRPLHQSSHWTPNWSQRPFCWTARLWLRPDQREMHSEQSNYDACWKKVKFYALISDCLD